jgi:phospho-N-acetylmuramoyl-pentapeptide-transferase
MIALLLAAAMALIVSLVITPLLMSGLRRRGIGQLIREEGPAGHKTKAGTPTMGGLAIVGGGVAGYLFAHVRSSVSFEATGLGLMGLIVALMGVGWLDDYLGISRGKNLGLNKRGKSGLQLVVAITFAVLAVAWIGASTNLSYARTLGVDLGDFGFVVWAVFLIVGSSNGVNLTDGLDGLAGGSAAMVFGAYVIIAFWQFRHVEVYGIAGDHALDTAVVAAAMLGGCIGFLWFNAAPAQIFMGDTGALAIGGGIAGLALVTNTHLLLPILSLLYVFETVSVILQIFSFHVLGPDRRFFKMAPIHHHFELLGWPETRVIVRFWLMAGMATALGLGLFYADFIQIPGARD